MEIIVCIVLAGFGGLCAAGGFAAGVGWERTRRRPPRDPGSYLYD